MTVGRVPPGVRASLDWLDFDDESRNLLEDFRHIMHFVWRGGRAEPLTVQEQIATAKELLAAINGFGLGKFFSRNDLIGVATGVSEYYSFPGGAIARLEQYFEELANGFTAPGPLVELWHELLESHHGDTLAASVAAEFLRPSEVS